MKFMENTENKISQKPSRFKALRISFTVYAIVIVGLAGFVGGTMVGRVDSSSQANTTKVGEIANKNTPPKYASKDVDMGEYWKIYDAIKSEYLRQPAALDPKLFYGSIKGMVAALGDPYSTFFDPDEAAQFSSMLEGSFEGIGAEIGFRNDGQMIVVAPLPATPAMKAGLKSGDAVIKINGEDTTGMALDLAITKIRGPKDTEVTLNIFRVGTKEPFDVKIIRDKIVVDSVKWKMVDASGKETTANGGFAWITVSEFNQDTVKEFDASLGAAELRGAKGIVIDLRDDPGGYLTAAVEVPRAWVGNQTVVIQRKSDGTQMEMKPTLKISPIGLPTVVLVNKWSASAAEIVTGALQDYGKATVVGETTFGKGSVQEYVDNFPDGSALKLTTAEWLTPKGRSIDKKGLVPDVAVALTDEDAKSGKDTQLEKALAIIKEKIDAQTKK